MNVIIFIDKDNFDGCLGLINKEFKKENRRFWNIDKYIPFLLEKVKNKMKEQELKLIKTFIYTGAYNSEIISGIKWECNNKIKERQKIIDIENSFLGEITKLCSDCDLKEKINKKIINHVENSIIILDNEKNVYSERKDKQIRNREGQKKFFYKINQNPLMELRTTLLKHAEGNVYQKGVDVKLATDLIHLAYTNAYDVAVILGGDTDLVECVRLVKENLSKTVIVIARYVKGDALSSNISDLKKIVASDFINLKDFSQEEINSMSDPLR